MALRYHKPLAGRTAHESQARGGPVGWTGDRLDRFPYAELWDYDGMATITFDGPGRKVEPMSMARLPSPEEVLGLRPATHLQDRIEELLAKNRAGGLSAEEQREWNRYEHLVRLAKVRAIQRQAQR